MGLFDRFLDKPSEKFNETEGLAGLALCAIAADGKITEDEVVGLSQTLSRMKLYHGMSNRQAQEAFGKSFAILQKKGVGGIKDVVDLSIPAIGPGLKPTAFAVFADLIMADGSVEDSEKMLLEDVQRRLAIPDETALKIVEVIGIKNKG